MSNHAYYACTTYDIYARLHTHLNTFDQNLHPNDICMGIYQHVYFFQITEYILNDIEQIEISTLN